MELICTVVARPRLCCTLTWMPHRLMCCAMWLLKAGLAAEAEG